MIKLVYLAKRKPGMTVEEFRKHWREIHGPLAKRLAKDLRGLRYVQSHPIDSPDGDDAFKDHNEYERQPFDGLTEFWWESEEDMMAALQSPEGKRAMELIAEDEENFLDRANCKQFLTQEIVIF